MAIKAIELPFFNPLILTVIMCARLGGESERTNAEPFRRILPHVFHCVSA